MKRIVICFSLMLWGFLWSRSSDLGELQTHYQASCVDLEVAYNNAVSNGFQSYVSSLSALKEKQQSLGNLDAVLFTISEISRAELERTYPTNTVTYTPVQELVVVAKSVFVRTQVDRARSLIALSSQYNCALEELKKQLTQSGQFHDASLVQKEQGCLVNIPNVAEALAVLSALDSGVPVLPNNTVTTPDLKLSGTKKSPSRKKFSLEIVVPVEQTSQLHISPKGLYWVSEGAKKPGMWGRGFHPTYVNGEKWLPTWKIPENTHGPDSTELYPLTFVPDDLEFRLIAIATHSHKFGIEDRDPVIFFKEGDEFVVRITDSQPGGRWYRFELVNK